MVTADDLLLDLGPKPTEALAGSRSYSSTRTEAPWRWSGKPGNRSRRAGLNCQGEEPLVGAESEDVGGGDPVAELPGHAGGIIGTRSEDHFGCGVG